MFRRCLWGRCFFSGSYWVMLRGLFTGVFCRFFVLFRYLASRIGRFFVSGRGFFWLWLIVIVTTWKCRCRTIFTLLISLFTS